MDRSVSATPIAAEALSGEPQVSLVVVAFGAKHLVLNLLNSLKVHPDRPIIREVVVVDNGYPEMGDSRLTVRAADYPFPVRFAQHHGRSYSRSINIGAALCGGSVLILLNDDVEWLPGFSILPAVNQVLRHPDVGVVGPQLVFPDGRWQRSAAIFPSVWEAFGNLLLLGVLENRVASSRHSRGAAAPAQDVDYVDGACLVVSANCFKQLGGFNAQLDFYAEDTDFSWRAKLAGWRRMVEPAARVMHIRGASSSALDRKAYAKRLLEAKRRFVEKTGGRFQSVWYDLLQRAVAVEYAMIYSAVAAVLRTPAAQARGRSARAIALAALEGGRYQPAQTYGLSPVDDRLSPTRPSHQG
jgi:GT2 family glycosyltransferase